MKLLAAMMVVSLLYGNCFAKEAATGNYWKSPVIPNVGRIHIAQDTAFKPPADAQYRVVFNVTAAVKSPNKINDGLRTVAYTLNVFAAAGVPPTDLHLVAVLHGPAINALLTDARYHAIYGVNNPNSVVISELHKQGVIVVACAQEIADVAFKTKMDPKQFRRWLQPDVRVAWSGLSTILMLQNKGYALYDVSD